MIRFGLLHLAIVAVTAGVAGAEGEKPLTPVEARKKVGSEVTAEMTVQAAKDRLEKRCEIYLDADEDFREEKKFAVVITKAGAASLTDRCTMRLSF